MFQKEKNPSVQLTVIPCAFLPMLFYLLIKYHVVASSILNWYVCPCWTLLEHRTCQLKNLGFKICHRKSKMWCFVVYSAISRMFPSTVHIFNDQTIINLTCPGGLNLDVFVSFCFWLLKQFTNWFSGKWLLLYVALKDHKVRACHSGYWQIIFDCHLAGVILHVHCDSTFF